MKARKKAVLTAAAVTALFTISGCGKNEVATVYGPPSYFRRLAEKRVEKEKEGSDEKK